MLNILNSSSSNQMEDNLSKNFDIAFPKEQKMRQMQIVRELDKVQKQIRENDDSEEKNGKMKYGKNKNKKTSCSFLSATACF